MACTLEHALYERGRLTALLDGDNVRHGLNKNLGFSADDRCVWVGVRVAVWLEVEVEAARCGVEWGAKEPPMKEPAAMETVLCLLVGSEATESNLQHR